MKNKMLKNFGVNFTSVMENVWVAIIYEMSKNHSHNSFNRKMIIFFEKKNFLLTILFLKKRNNKVMF